ncbi:MAG: cytochrome c family protein [Magnetococcales bacterium]|nr:cytochrome c family protein [Magnetococcales bacterium]
MLSASLVRPASLSALLLLIMIWTLPVQAGKKQPLHHLSATSCGECHQEIYAQWKSSMHAKSTALEDPIHAAFYGMMVGNPKKEGEKHKISGKFPVCLNCHAPNAARDGTTKLDASTAYSEGVTCVTCHTMESYKGIHGKDGKMQLGAKAYTFSSHRLQGPNGAFKGANPTESPGSSSSEPTVNPFPHAANPRLFKSSDACLGCHDQRKNPNGVPLCSTGPELVASGNSITCQSCHMPISGGFADHTMGGGHTPAMLKRGIVFDLTAKAAEAGVETRIRMKNNLPHNYPTGAPFRNVFIVLTAMDAKGEVLWKNFTNSPFTEDKKGILMLKLADDAGKPAPPPKATKIAGDSRLKPGEERSIAYMIPVNGVAKIRAELRYALLTPPLVKKFAAKLPDEAKGTTLVAQSEVVLP